MSEIEVQAIPMAEEDETSSLGVADMTNGGGGQDQPGLVESLAPSKESDLGASSSSSLKRKQKRSLIRKRSVASTEDEGANDGLTSNGESHSLITEEIVTTEEGTEAASSGQSFD